MTDTLGVVRVADGLWQWTLPHAQWTPEIGNGEGGWPQRVASTYAEIRGGIVLVDPIVPNPGLPDAQRFWRYLDADVARVGHAPTTIITCRWHTRSARDVAERFGGPVVAIASDSPNLDGLVTDVVRDGDDVGPGATIIGVDEPGNAECVVFLRAHRTLVVGDVILGSPEGGLKWAPCVWDADGVDHAAVRASRRVLVERLASLDLDRVLVAHWDGVHSDVGTALEALRADLE